ncbi:uncharacterized protein FOBCDRAFT_227657 [Fusarium oxysporum Fo47]|uniref:EGF-like domain-containing protein n=1 Tax=Fusarium oxysporum Fo47 TaxID=660027 RepID=W9J8L7_FUSOX|nr:uncharacterized protein FOBCDRAFT_227657 [Fusarium oxysporum Fo47]EWZ28377.1 hypothetical protein FOZG_17944 [Fusarium oxysporum Fo47]QKD57105.2 hypothetical protein FOBCDRAFT_227657 [Fusarium oxysporum Fo47]
MLLKLFVLNTLLAQTPVTALPRPGTVNYGLNVRDINSDLAADDVIPVNCGPDASWDDKLLQCVCNGKGLFFDSHQNKCVCPNGLVFNPKNKKCECPEGKVANLKTKECECLEGKC